MEVHKDYPCHVDNYQRGRAQPVSFLVFHYVGATGGAEANARYYGRTPGIGASAHYFVGHASEGAAIWQSVAEADTAWHCGANSYRHPTCRNSNSIGIEMCCHLDYQATGSRRRAFCYSFLSGLAEPLGALLVWLVLRPIMSDTVFGLLFAGVAGMMVFISFDELLPAAREYGEHHLSIYGLISGMVVMAISLLLFL